MRNPCDTSKDFWFSVIEWFKEHSFGVNHLSALDITFGLISKENLLLNHIIILGKHVIYQSRSLNIKPTLMLLKAKIRSTYQIESFRAEKNKDLEIHKKNGKSCFLLWTTFKHQYSLTYQFSFYYVPV